MTKQGNTIESNTTTSRTSRTSSTITSTTTGTITTRPGVSITEAYEDIAMYYEQALGCPVNYIVMEKIREYHEHYSIDFPVIRAALRDTGLARYPSPRYLFAILDRCVRDEIETIGDWERSKYMRTKGARWY